MKRVLIIGGVALTLLASSGAALAAAGAFNTFGATETFSAATAGSPSHPSPVSFHEVWTAQGNNGHMAGPITDVVSKTYGIKTNASKFPVCTATMINNNGNTKLPPYGWNAICPKGSLIAGGPVSSMLMPPKSPTAGGAACTPYLYVYNGGVKMYKGKPTQEQTFFFAEAPYAPAQYTCVHGAIPTGGAPAYTGYITQPSAGNGNTMTVHIPLIPQVSTMAGGQPLYASLTKLSVNYKKLTRKVHGKTVAYAESIGCQHGTRPYSFTFKAQNYQGYTPATQTTTVPGTASCI